MPIPADMTYRNETDLIFRRENMSMIHETLARAHSTELRAEAQQHRRARRLIVARRTERRALRASQRARRLAAAAYVASSRI